MVISIRPVPSELSVFSIGITWFMLFDQWIKSFPDYIIMGAYCSSSSAHLTLFPVHISDAGPATSRRHTPLGVIYSVTEQLYIGRLYFFHIVHMIRYAAVRGKRATHLSPALDIKILLYVVYNEARVKICNIMENKVNTIGIKSICCFFSKIAKLNINLKHLPSPKRLYFAKLMKSCPLSDVSIIFLRQGSFLG